jgi:hypothetical protein
MPTLRVGITMVAVLAALLLSPVDGLGIGEIVQFEAVTLAGKAVSSSVLEAKPSVVLLWGPWSAGSSRALVDISKLSNEDHRARFIGLASWDQPDNVRTFLNTLAGVDIEMWIDPAGKNPTDSIAVKVFKTRRFPSVYVLDRKQRVVGSFLSYKASDDVRSLITKAIGPSG